MQDDIRNIAQRLDEFARVRDWEQFHSPKNLAMALNVEAGELLEHFQWLTEEQSRAPTPETRTKMEHEIADIQIYLIRLADKLGVDILAATRSKIEDNEARYPADKVRGSAKKYSDYAD